MREIIRNIRMDMDGKPMDFRLTKLDAFSGAELLRMLAKMPAADGETGPEQTLVGIFASLPAEDLRSLMVSCLNHVEVLLPAGYQPVMQGQGWSWPDLEHDTAACLKLCMEETLWTLEGFFGGGGPSSRPDVPPSNRTEPRT